MRNTQKDSFSSAENEIEQIFKGLQLDNFKREKEIILEKFKVIQPAFRNDNKYRDPKLLIPIIIYVCPLLFDHKINKSDLLVVSNISRADFNDFILQLKNYLSKEKRYLKC